SASCIRQTNYPLQRFTCAYPSHASKSPWRYGRLQTSLLGLSKSLGNCRFGCLIFGLKLVLLRFNEQSNAGEVGLAILRPRAYTVQYCFDLSFGHGSNIAPARGNSNRGHAALRCRVTSR